MHTSSSSPFIYHFFIYINLLTILLTVHSMVYGHTTLPSCSDLSVATAAQAQVVYCSPFHPSSQQQQLTAKAVRSIAEFKSSSSSPRRKSINNKLNKPSSSSSSSSSEFIVDIQKNLPNLSFAAAISYLLYEYFRKVGGGGGGNESSSDKVTQ